MGRAASTSAASVIRLDFFFLLKVKIHCTSLNIFKINLKPAVLKSAPCLTSTVCGKVKGRPTVDLAAL